MDNFTQCPHCQGEIVVTTTLEKKEEPKPLYEINPEKYIKIMVQNYTGNGYHIEARLRVLDGKNSPVLHDNEYISFTDSDTLSWIRRK